MEKSLLETNPYLKDPEHRREQLIRNVLTSSAIEGILVAEEELERYPEERDLSVT